MKPLRAICHLAGAASMVVASANGLWAEEGDRLQPYQMVRSLELVQDRIASGDHAAMPMQRKLLEMIDARFAANDDTRFENELNRHALLVYAMSGGNPTTVESALARLGADDPVSRLGNGILAYIKGEPMAARSALGGIDPTSYTPDIGAYLALIKGSIYSGDEPEIAVALLDRARLLSPGTLVEEAALRRTIAIAATLGDTRRFLRASEQYVRGYLRSPYASQFADAFVEGVVVLYAAIDFSAVKEIAALMQPEQEKVIFLRIARRAAIDGMIELSAFASARAEGDIDDPRAVLYSSLASVTSETVTQVLGDLSKIDRSQLSESDQRLLDAASAVAREMTAAPDGMPAIAATAAPPPVRSVGPKPVLTAEFPAMADHSEPETHDLEPETMAPEPAGPASGVDATADQADAMMTEARAKLSDIDKLLGEMPE